MERLVIETIVIALTYLIGHHMGYRKCFDRWWNESLREKLIKDIEDSINENK